jgi:hypothetical protein
MSQDRDPRPYGSSLPICAHAYGRSPYERARYLYEEVPKKWKTMLYPTQLRECGASPGQPIIGQLHHRSTSAIAMANGWYQWLQHKRLIDSTITLLLASSSLYEILIDIIFSYYGVARMK